MVRKRQVLILPELYSCSFHHQTGNLRVMCFMVWVFSPFLLRWSNRVMEPGGKKKKNSFRTLFLLTSNVAVGEWLIISSVSNQELDLSLLGPTQCDQVKPAAFKGLLCGSNSASLLPWTQMKNGMAENRETMPKPAPAQESGAVCT